MSQYRDTMGRAEEGMESAKNRIREGMDSARSAAYDAKDYVTSKLEDARSSMHDSFESLRDTDYDEVWDSMKDRVRENPGPALLIAGAVGLAIGVFLAGSGAAVTRRR